jgi:acetyl-CoA carboxylase carboxyl transferase subunit beta
MQMAKTADALASHYDARLPFISILLNPTTAGVAASYAALGDVIIAEPQAMVGFAGPRVIQQTINQELPEGFQTAEFVIEHGMIDMIVPRLEMRETVGRLLDMLLVPVREVAATPEETEDSDVAAAETAPAAVSADAAARAGAEADAGTAADDGARAAAGGDGVGVGADAAGAAPTDGGTTPAAGTGPPKAQAKASVAGDDVDAGAGAAQGDRGDGAGRQRVDATPGESSTSSS